MAARTFLVRIDLPEGAPDAAIAARDLHRAIDRGVEEMSSRHNVGYLATVLSVRPAPGGSGPNRVRSRKP